MLKKILFVLLLIGVTSLYASPSSIVSSDLIIIRVYTPLSKTEAGIIKVYKNNEPVSMINLLPSTDYDDNNTYLKIREVLNQYTSEGYSISTSNSSFGPAFGGGLKVITIYVLEKK